MEIVNRDLHQGTKTLLKIWALIYTHQEWDLQVQMNSTLQCL
jgi:hypothetical protein